jgi:SPP1 family predicted phage head-tail adaptor
MRAGAFSERVSVQQNTPTTSSRGERVDSWATISTVWADVRALRGQEYYLAQQVNADAQYKVTLWYDSRIGTKDRLIWGSRTLEVVSPPIDIGNRHKQLELMCREVNP